MTNASTIFIRKYHSSSGKAAIYDADDFYAEIPISKKSKHQPKPELEIVENHRKSQHRVSPSIVHEHNFPKVQKEYDDNYDQLDEVVDEYEDDVDPYATKSAVL